jgi:uncharacterized protein DUF4386
MKKTTELEAIEQNNYQRPAIIAGILYLFLIVIGMFSMAYIPTHFIIEGDAAATLSTISESELLFRFGKVNVLLTNIVSILLALYLYKLLKQVDQNLSLFMLVLLLPGAIISMINEVNHFVLISLIQKDFLTADINNFSLDLARLFLRIHEYGVFIAVIFWGLWLLPLGRLIYNLKSRISKIIGVLLVIAGAGYLIDSIVKFMIPDYGIMPLADYTFIGELILPLWLLIKSSDIEKLILQKH